MMEAACEPSWKESPVACFYVLEDAKRRGDFERAAVAKNALKEMGIEVKYRPRKLRRGRRDG